jgi:hypothetical protein
VTNAGLDDIVLAQKLGDRPSFGWGFDNYQRFLIAHSLAFFLKLLETLF